MNIAVEPPKKGILLIDKKYEKQKNKILIKTLEVGICKTDKEIIKGIYGESPKEENFLILGHEALGRIVYIGEEVKTDLKEGDLVVPTVRRGCNKCFYCMNEESDKCLTDDFLERGIKGLHGYLSNHFLETPENLIKIPEELKDVAVLLEPLSIGEKSIQESLNLLKLKQIRDYTKLKALVEGSGPIGMLTSFILRDIGFDTYTFDRRDEECIKSKLLKEINAHHINIKQTDLSQLPKFNLIVEATGISRLTFNTINLLSNNGIFVMTGIPQEEKSYEIPSDEIMNNMVLRNQVLFGTVNSNRTHFETARDRLLKFKNEKPEMWEAANKVITKKFPVEQYKEAFDLEDHYNNIKIVLTFEK